MNAQLNLLLTFKKQIGFYTCLVAMMLLNISASLATPCTTPPSGIVNWWPANGSAYDIIGGDHGTLVNGTTYAPGEVCLGFSFDGSDDSVNFGTTAANFGTNDFTVEFWIQTTSTRHEAVLGKRAVCDAASLFSLRLSEIGAIDLELAQDNMGNNYNAHAGTIAVNDGFFHHVAAVRHGTNASLYIDGVLDISNSTVGITVISNAAPLLAGDGPCVGVDGTEVFTGVLDEISIYNRALTTNEIINIFNSGENGKCNNTCGCFTNCVFPGANLVNWWTANDTTNDIVGGNDATLLNGATYTTGEVCSGFSFDGIDDSVNFGTTAANFGTNDFTVEFWIQTTSTRHEAVLGKRAVCDADSLFSLRLSDIGAIDLELAQDNMGNNYNAHAGTIAVNDGFFHHVAAVRQGTNATLYIDGVLDISNSTAGITVISNAAPLLAGDGPCVGVDGTEFFTGVLDEISIYSRALTIYEIQDIFNAGTNGKCH